MNGYDAPLNGGLYTGEPFARGAPWGNIPMVPDTDYMIHTGLKSANPPHDALMQYPGYVRKGNNNQTMPGTSVKNGYACNSALCLGAGQTPRFSKYYYF